MKKIECSASQVILANEPSLSNGHDEKVLDFQEREKRERKKKEREKERERST